MNGKNNIENDALREALRLMTEEMRPSSGWELRVLAQAPVKRSRMRWLLPVAGCVAAACIALLCVNVERNAEVVADPSAPSVREAVVAEAAPVSPAPSVKADPRQQVVPVSRRHVAKDTVKILLPESIPYQPDAPTDLDIPVGDYIDGLLAQQLVLQQELLSSVTDPYTDNSSTPIY